MQTSGRSKEQVLRELGREMVAEARAELESAASRQVDPPMWGQQIMSEVGWNHYWRLHNERQHHKPGPAGLRWFSFSNVCDPGYTVICRRLASIRDAVATITKRTAAPECDVHLASLATGWSW